jgi:hypothetical protein
VEPEFFEVPLSDEYDYSLRGKNNRINMRGLLDNQVLSNQQSFPQQLPRLLNRPIPLYRSPASQALPSIAKGRQGPTRTARGQRLETRGRITKSKAPLSPEELEIHHQ